MSAPTPSKQDMRQVLQGVYDEDNGLLRTSASATIVNADIDVSLDSTEDNVAIASSTGVELQIEANGSINTNTSITSSVLPTGAATSAKQDTLIAKDFATAAKQDLLLAQITSEDDIVVSGTISTQNLTPTGTATVNSAIEIDCKGKATVSMLATGTFTGTFGYQYTLDGTTWHIPASAVMQRMANGAYAVNLNSTGVFKVNVSGYAKVRISMDTAMTGSSIVYLRASKGVALLVAPLLETITTAINTKTPTLGSQASSTSTPIVISDSLLVTGTAQSVIEMELLTGISGGWYDAKAFKSAAVQIIRAGAGSGTIFFEQTNDTTLAPAGNFLGVHESTSVVTNPFYSAITVATGTTRMFEFPIVSRYVRVRIAQAITSGGTVQAVAMFSQLPYAAVSTNIQQTTAGSLNVTAVGTVNAYLTQINAGVTDVVSAAITATTTTSTMTPNFGIANSFLIAVTAASGTLPVMDIVIQESDDNINWFDIYHFPRITAVGAYRSPPMRQHGRFYRYIQTIAGTTPSFTRSITRNQYSSPSNTLRQFIDRTITLTTLNSVTPTYYTEGVSNFQLIVSIGATTIAPQVILEGSETGLAGSWYTIGTPLVGVANTTTRLTINDEATRFVQARVSTAGTATTLDYVCIRGF